MTDRHHSNRIFSLLIVLFLLSWSGSQLEILREKVQEIKLQPPPASTEPFAAKVYYLDQEEQDDLVARLEIIEINESGGYLLVRLDPTERQELEADGYRVEIPDGET